MSTLEEVTQKITKIEKSGHFLAFDGCHKIYIVTDPEEASEASEGGYDLYPSSDIVDLIDRSCGLVFVSYWSLNEGPLEIDQTELYEAGYFGEVEEE